MTKRAYLRVGEIPPHFVLKAARRGQVPGRFRRRSPKKRGKGGEESKKKKKG